MTVPSNAVPSHADAFTDELAAHLQARRGAVAATVTMPDFESILDRPTPLTRVGGSGHRRRSATIALAAAAAMLLVVGVLVLTRDDDQRVSTLPASQVRRLAGPGTPLLLPPGDDATAEFTPSAATMNDLAPIPTEINGTIETLVSGRAGQTARLLTLVASGPRDDALADPFSSMRRSDMFDPGDWFEHPENEPTGAATGTDATTSIPGADRAILVTEDDRPSILALRRGDQRVALIGEGLDDADLVAIARDLQFADAAAGVAFGDVPSGFAPLVPRGTNPQMFGVGYGARSKAGSITVTALPEASFSAALDVHNTGGFAPGWTVLRSGPDWVLQLDDHHRNVAGVRDGGWVTVNLPKGGGLDGPVALAAFDGIRKVDIDTFAAAMGSGTMERERQLRKGVEETIDRVQKWGGWLPKLPADYELADYGLIGTNPVGVGGLTGLVPLWEPATGATLRVGDAVPSDSAIRGSDEPADLLLETVRLGGRETEIRSWPTMPGELHAIFDDGDGHRVQTMASSATIEQVRAYTASITRLDDRTWTATPPPGFEPIPLARPTDAASTHDPAHQNTGINVVELNFSIPGSKERVAVDVHEPDLAVASDQVSQFFSMGRVERMTTGGVAWYRVRDAAGQRLIAVPGSTSRPTIVAASSALTDEQLFEIAASVRQVADRDVRKVFAPLLDG